MLQALKFRLKRPHRVALALALPAVVVPVAIYGNAKLLSWSSFGEYLGTLGLLLVVISLFLMLRFAWLARVVGGLEAMYRLHRGFGIAGYVVMLVHPLAFAQEMGVQALSPFDKHWGFVVGWVALVFLMVTLLFTFVLRPAGYAKWRNLHWLTALAFVLMVGHVIFYQDDWRIDAVLAVDAILLLGLLSPLARYILVDRGVAVSKYRVTAVDRPITGVIDLKLAPHGKPLAITPGQFVFARFMSGENYEGCAHFHPFTASSVFADGELRISIKSAGRCTEMMQRIAAGAEARLQGPFGKLFEDVREDIQIWIAGGIGITPFMARARVLTPLHGKVKLFYLYDKESKEVFLAELKELAADNENFEVFPVITHGLTGVATSVFDAMLPPWNDKSYILCGPPGLTRAVRDYLAAHNVGPGRIYEERFDFR